MNENLKSMKREKKSDSFHSYIQFYLWVDDKPFAQYIQSEWWKWRIKKKSKKKEPENVCPWKGNVTIIIKGKDRTWKENKPFD